MGITVTINAGENYTGPDLSVQYFQEFVDSYSEAVSNGSIVNSHNFSDVVVRFLDYADPPGQNYLGAAVGRTVFLDLASVGCVLARTIHKTTRCKNGA